MTAVRPGGSHSAMAETVINLRGLKCPLPALRTRKALTRLPAGDIIEIGRAHV